MAHSEVPVESTSGIHGDEVDEEYDDVALEALEALMGADEAPLLPPPPAEAVEAAEARPSQASQAASAAAPSLPPRQSTPRTAGGITRLSGGAVADSTSSVSATGASSPATNSCVMESNSSLFVTHRTAAFHQLSVIFCEYRFVPLARAAAGAAAGSPAAVGGDRSQWCTLGVVTRKNNPQHGAGGGSFGILTLWDMVVDHGAPPRAAAASSGASATHELGILLRAAAFESHFIRLAVGDVLCVCGLEELPARPGGPSQKLFAARTASQIKILGRSPDLGTCAATTRAGEPCLHKVNTRRLKYCSFHLGQALADAKKDAARATAASSSTTSGRRSVVLGGGRLGTATSTGHASVAGVAPARKTTPKMAPSQVCMGVPVAAPRKYPLAHLYEGATGVALGAVTSATAPHTQQQQQQQQQQQRAVASAAAAPRGSDVAPPAALSRHETFVATRGREVVQSANVVALGLKSSSEAGLDVAARALAPGPLNDRIALGLAPSPTAANAATATTTPSGSATAPIGGTARHPLGSPAVSTAATTTAMGVGARGRQVLGAAINTLREQEQARRERAAVCGALPQASSTTSTTSTTTTAAAAGSKRARCAAPLSAPMLVSADGVVGRTTGSTKEGAAKSTVAQMLGFGHLNVVRAAREVTSRNDDLHRANQRRRLEQRIGHLEKIDEAIAALEQITEQDVEAFFCAECRRWASTRPTTCVEAGHRLEKRAVKKKFFACDNCSHKITFLGGLGPLIACPRCKSSAGWTPSNAAPARAVGLAALRRDSASDE